jgi:hypothetical protein
MNINYPPELEKMLKENPDLEVLLVSVVFNKKEPMTKRKKKELAHNVYEAALKQLDTFKP